MKETIKYFIFLSLILTYFAGYSHALDCPPESFEMKNLDHFDHVLIGRVEAIKPQLLSSKSQVKAKILKSFIGASTGEIKLNQNKAWGPIFEPGVYFIVAKGAQEPYEIPLCSLTAPVIDRQKEIKELGVTENELPQFEIPSNSDIQKLFLTKIQNFSRKANDCKNIQCFVDSTNDQLFSLTIEIFQNELNRNSKRSISFLEERWNEAKNLSQLTTSSNVDVTFNSHIGTLKTSKIEVIFRKQNSKPETSWKIYQFSIK